MQISKKNIDKIVDKFYKDIEECENVLYSNTKGNEKYVGYYFDNYPSILIFLSYYNSFTHSKKATQMIYKYLDFLINSLREKKSISMSFAYGMSGVLFSLEIVKNVGNVDIDLDNIHQSYEKFLKLRLVNTRNKLKKSILRSIDYDFINGISSNLLIMSMFSKDKALIKENINVLCDCVDYLIFGTQNKCDLGVAHGLGGILLALVNAHKRVNLDVETTKKIENYLRIISNLYKEVLFSKRGREERIFLNPWDDQILLKNIDSNISVRRQSWCYGTPGITYGLFEVAKILHDRELTQIVNKIFTLINKMSISSMMLDTPTFCHGISGTLSIFLNLKSQGMGNIDSIIERLIKSLLNEYHTDKIFGFRDFDFISRGKNMRKIENLLTSDCLMGHQVVF